MIHHIQRMGSFAVFCICNHDFDFGNFCRWYYSDRDTDAIPHTGRVTTYELSGFEIYMPNTKAEALKIMNDLQANRWIDEHTRAIFVDMIIYNANINLFNHVR